MKRKTLLPRRRGSALIMVLGMLAILMLMAIAFGTFVRTERSGSTNLKNGAVARNALYTAVGRVIEAIDLSFDSPDGDWPASVWPNPWIASSKYTDDDFVISEKRGSLDRHEDRPDLTQNERNRLAQHEDDTMARVLTDEIARYLSPAQLALARNAKCKWAPLNGAITATERNASRDGGLLGDIGRPKGDDLIGRYAFIVLDTTGLPDMNAIGLNDQGPEKRDPSDPTTFVLPTASVAGTVEDAYHKAENKPPYAFTSFVRNLDDFADNRMFASLADARATCSAATFDNGPFRKGDVLPADLFSGFSPSLAELNPAGLPKIVLPSQKDFNGYSESAAKSLFGRVFSAMVAVFARSRASDPDNGVASLSTRPPEHEYGWDHMTIFPGTDWQYNLNRSALAAVSIMDGLDGDNSPGKSVVNDGQPKYWTYFGNEKVSAPHEVGGVMPAETVLAGVSKADVRNNQLNFPCTESAFLLDSVGAWITWKKPGKDFGNADDGETYDYEATLHVKALVRCANTTDETSKHTPNLRMEWFVMTGEPRDGYSSRAGNDKIQEDDLDWENDDGDKLIDWDDLFVYSTKRKQPVRGHPRDTEWQAGSATDDKNRTDATILSIEDEFSFNVTVAAVSKLDDDGEPEDWMFLPPTRAEYDLDDDTYEDYGPDGKRPKALKHSEDIFLPVAVKVYIQDKKGSGAFVDVQQVPAPALESDSSKGWWVRVNPCVYHGPGSDFSGAGDPWGDPEKGKGNAGGWAFCLAPPFAFDTTSLRDPYCENKEMNFWVGDLMSRSSSGAGGVGSGGSDAADEVLKGLFWEKGGNANFSENFVAGNTGVGGTGLSTLQENWLTDYNTYNKYASSTVLTKTQREAGRRAGPFGVWLDRSNEKQTPSTEDRRRFMPDFLHKAGKSRKVFHDEIEETLSSSEFYSRIPASGYKCAADLGNAMCGPFETLSLFKTWRTTQGSDFHPVLDYFATESDRYPSTNDIRKYVVNGGGEFKPDKGDMDWKGLSREGDDLFSAAHNGRVNLNLPRLVQAAEPPSRGAPCSPTRYNPFPAAMVFNGAKVFSKNQEGSPTPRWIGEEEAFTLAFDVCRMLEGLGTGDESLRDVSWGESLRFSSSSNSVRRPFVRNISFLEQGKGDDNPLLSDFLAYRLEGTGSKGHYPQNDADREGLLRATADGFCTRGQTFLAIVRADAYSPKFGENKSAEDGSTLATTHALVELFRDPVPARAPDGSLPVDEDGNPIVYHNWYIRSFRVF